MKTHASLWLVLLAWPTWAAAASLPNVSEIDLAEVKAALASRGVSESSMKFPLALLDELRGSASGEITKQVVANAIARAAIPPKMSRERTADLLAAELTSAMSVDERKRGESPLTPYVTALLLPYMIEANLCSGHVVSGAGLVCAYVYGGHAADASAQIKREGALMRVAAPPHASDLARVISLAEQQCLSRALTVQASAAAPSVDQCFQLRSAESRLTVVRLGELEFDAYHAQLVLKINEFIEWWERVEGASLSWQEALEIFVTEVLIPWIVENSVEVEVYGEYYLAANIQYGLAESDSAFLVYPFGFICTIGDCEKIKECEAAADFVACADQHVERGHWDLRPGGGVLTHSIAACAAMPVSYEVRPPYVAIQNGLYPVPQNLRFQTAYQVSPAGPSLNDAHLYPKPTTYTGPAVPFPYSPTLGDEPTWKYNITKIRSWEHNFVFAGLRDANPAVLANGCANTRYAGGNAAHGNVFWAWQGVGHDDTRDCDEDVYQVDNDCPGYLARADSGFPMPDFYVIFGSTVDHALVSCGAPTSVVSIRPDANTEGNALAFTVVRAGYTDTSATVAYRTENVSAVYGRDYEARSGVVTFQPGEVLATVSVPTIRDAEIEGAEQMEVRLSNPSGGAELGVASARGVIADPAPAIISVSPSAMVESGNVKNVKVPTVTFNVTRSGNMDSEVTVRYRTRDPILLKGSRATANWDYIPASGTLVFPATDASKQNQVVSVQILDDWFVEDNEFVELELYSASGAQFLSDGSSTAASGAIIDDDCLRDGDYRRCSPGGGVTPGPHPPGVPSLPPLDR